jgi:hypothetical protein
VIWPLTGVGSAAVAGIVARRLAKLTSPERFRIRILFLRS